nr:formin-like protein 6 [Microcebus murinus]
MLATAPGRSQAEQSVQRKQQQLLEKGAGLAKALLSPHPCQPRSPSNTPPDTGPVQTCPQLHPHTGDYAIISVCYCAHSPPSGLHLEPRPHNQQDHATSEDPPWLWPRSKEAWPPRPPGSISWPSRPSNSSPSPAVSAPPHVTWALKRTEVQETCQRGGFRKTPYTRVASNRRPELPTGLYPASSRCVSTCAPPPLSLHTSQSPLRKPEATSCFTALLTTCHRSCGSPLSPAARMSAPGGQGLGFAPPWPQSPCTVPRGGWALDICCAACKEPAGLTLPIQGQGPGQMPCGKGTLTEDGEEVKPFLSIPGVHGFARFS